MLVLMGLIITCCLPSGKMGGGEGSDIRKGGMAAIPSTTHRTGGCYSEDQGLQCYWRSGH